MPEGMVAVLGPKWLLASSQPCNEGGGGNKPCQPQAMSATRWSVPAKLPEDVFCASDRHVIRARPTKGSDRGKRDLTLIVRPHCYEGGGLLASEFGRQVEMPYPLMRDD